METEVKKPSGISHDAASRLLDLSPNDLEKLVKAGHIRREDKNSYNPGVLIGDYIKHIRGESDRHPTQEETAQHVGVSDRTIRELEQKLTLPANYTLEQFRLAYTAHLREVAAGRTSATGEALDLAAERAALAREQRIAQKMKNDVASGEYAPIGLLSDVLGVASSAVVDRFDQLEGTLRKSCPGIDDEVMTVVMRVVASARNEWIRSTVKLVTAAVETMVDDEEEDLVLPDLSEGVL